MDNNISTIDNWLQLRACPLSTLLPQPGKRTSNTPCNTTKVPRWVALSVDASTPFSVVESMLPTTLRHKSLLRNPLLCISTPVALRAMSLPPLQIQSKILALLHTQWISQFPCVPCPCCGIWVHQCRFTHISHCKQCQSCRPCQTFPALHI